MKANVATLLVPSIILALIANCDGMMNRFGKSISQLFGGNDERNVQFFHDDSDKIDERDMQFIHDENDQNGANDYHVTSDPATFQWTAQAGTAKADDPLRDKLWEDLSSTKKYWKQPQDQKQSLFEMIKPDKKHTEKPPSWMQQQLESSSTLQSQIGLSNPPYGTFLTTAGLDFNVPNAQKNSMSGSSPSSSTSKSRKGKSKQRSQSKTPKPPKTTATTTTGFGPNFKIPPLAPQNFMSGTSSNAFGGRNTMSTTSFTPSTAGFSNTAQWSSRDMRGLSTTTAVGFPATVSSSSGFNVPTSNSSSSSFQPSATTDLAWPTENDRESNTLEAFLKSMSKKPQ